MGLVVSWWVQCEKCGFEFGEEEVRENIIIRAKNKGWHEDEATEDWLCPTCHKEEGE